MLGGAHPAPVQAQTITSVQPQSGASDTPVRIYGDGFSTSGDNTVSFGGTEATVDSAKSTVLYVKVPSGPSGPVDVTVSNLSGTTTAETAFSVLTGGAASFANARVGLDGTEAGSIEWADFNNDGTLDLLVTGDTSGVATATVYLADGSGGYDPANAGLTGVLNSASAVGDVNGDGRLDIVLAGEDENFDVSTTVYLNQGGGNFSPADAGLTGVQNGSVSLGDVNGDGNLDVVLTGQDNDFNRTAAVYLGDGTGDFSPAGAGLNAVENSSSSLGDLDGDGNLDLVVTGDTSDASTTVYLGDGTGGFSTADAGLTGVQNGASTLGDVDGDGTLDLVVTGDDTNFDETTIVYLGEGTGDFSTAGAGVPGGVDGSVSLGDVDGSGALDLLVTGDRSGTPFSTLYLGEAGTGQFAEAAAVLPGVEKSDASLADADGDGDLDLALAGVTGLNSNRIARVYRNEAVSAATSLGVSNLRPRVGAPGTTMQIEGSGFTSSTTVTFGTTSATVTNATSTTLTVTVPSGESGPVPVTVEESGTSMTAADRFTVVSGGSGTLTGLGAGLDDVDDATSAWGDFNEDGQLDLLLSGRGSVDAKTLVYLGDGSGGFTKAGADLLRVDIGASDVGDVNGDGHLDFVLAGAEGGSDPITAVYLGDGTGRFTRAEAGLRGLQRGSANFGDLNGDGNLDLVVTGSDANGDPQTDVYLGYGDGQFAPAGAGLTGLEGGSSVFGDLNGDGTLDLVVTGRDGSFTRQTIVYLGDGTGGFSTAGAGLTPVDDSSLELGYVDGDGALDLVLNGRDSNSDRITTVYLGDGGGGFSPAGAALPGVGNGSSDLGDVNGDGTLDLVLAGGFEGSSVPETALFLGDGNGNFTRAGLGLVGVRRSTTELGDLDGDGDLDLLAAGGGRFSGTYVYENEAITATTDLGASTLRPRTGTAGTSVRVGGSGFTSETTVTFGGSSATVNTATSTALTVAVPSGERGPVPVTVDELGTTVTAADRFVAVEDDSAAFSNVETNLEGITRGSVEWADFDEDGTLDLVTSAGTVYLGNETGFFTKAGAGLSGGGADSPLDVGDVNGDGHLDVVLSQSVGEFDGNTTKVFLGDGTGSFTESPATLPALTDGSATLGDLNNDGNLDLVLTGEQGTGDPFTKVYLGYGDGRFAGTNTDVVPVKESTTNLADLDGDGNLDLVATGDSTENGGESTSIYLGDGTGGFTKQGLGLTGVTDGSSNVGDFDNDGNLDLLVTGLTQNFNSSATVYLGDGTGGFTPAGTSLTPVDRSSSAVGDVNGDGNLDLTLTGFDTDNNEVSEVYLGDGTGSFTTLGTGLAGVNDGTSDFGDLDGDGELDLVVTGADTNGDPAAFLYRNGPLARPPLRVTGLQPQSAAPGESIRIYGTAFDTSDVSNNTVSFGGTQATATSATTTSLTVPVPSSVSGAVDVTVTTPNGSATAPTRFTAVTDGSTTYAPLGNALPDVEEGSSNWADFNDDGNLDLFVSGDSTGSGDPVAAVYLGDGTGGFTRAGAGLTGVERSASVVGDLDNDGNLDLVVSGDDESGSFLTAVYLGDGTGGFTRVDAGLPNVSDESLSLGDLDGDGNLDLILTGGDEAGVFFGDGEGRFVNADVGLASISDGASAVGDVNNDGNLDFVVTGEADFDPTATLYLGDGSGGFTTANAGINGVDFGTTDFADLNGDGNLDLVVTGDSTSGGDPSTVLYLGDGSGGFSVADAGLTGVVNSSVEIGDLDGDGNRDLLVTGDSTGGDVPSTTLYLGDGSGSFTTASTPFVDVRNGSSALGNLDGDGDLDLALTGNVREFGDERRTVVYQNESITPASGLNVTDLRPRSGPPGSTVRIAGSGFSSTPSNNTVTFGGVTATVVRATTSALTVEVPSGVSGRVPVSVSGTAAPDRFSVVTDGSTSFTTLPTPPEAVRRGAVEWGDFNEDGILDLVVAGDSTTGDPVPSATLYLGGGTGGFTKADAGLTGVFEASSDVGDVNGDGHLDLVLTGRDASFEPTTTVYLGDGTGSFTKTRARLPAIEGGSSTFGDVNGDGHLDLVLAGRDGRNNPSAAVYLGYGDGRFAKADAGVVGVSRSSSTLGDVNNDDNLDLVVTGTDTSGSRSARVYLGDGTGSFSPAGAQLTGVELGSSDIGDVNGDGNLDLVVTGLDENADESTRIYLGDGAGGFSSAGAGLDGVQSGTSEFGDVNGDGNLDLVVTGEQGGDAVTELYFGDGTGSFSRASASDNLTGVVRGASALGDVFGDGTLDLFVTGEDATFSGNLTSALYRNGAGPLPIAPAPATDLAASATQGDVSLTWTASDSGNVAWYRIYRGTAPIDSSRRPSDLIPIDSTDGSTTSFTDANVTSGRGYYYRVTAVDGDGVESEFSSEVQVVPGARFRLTGLHPASGVPGAPVRLFGTQFDPATADNTVTFDGTVATVTNAMSTALTVDVPSGPSGPVPVGVSTTDSSGTVASPFTAVTAGSGSFNDIGAGILPVEDPSSTWGDFNDDGHLDLVVTGEDSTDQETPITTLYLGDGSGGFTKTEAGLADVSPAFVSGEASSAGDLNGDGHLDLVLVGEDSNGDDSTWVYLGDSMGAFTPASSLPEFSSLEIGDVNEDGNLDLLNLSFGGGTVYFGNGSGEFPSSTPIGLNNSFVSGSDLGDVNGDGHLDVVVAGETNEGVPAVRIHLGDGSGRFTRADAGLTGLYFGSTEFGDVNGDGNLDLVVTGTDVDGNPEMHVYLGDGAGGFSKANADLVGSAYGDLAVGDVNGDGASDLVVAGTDTSFTTATTLYFSDGSGNFTQANADLTPLSNGNASFGDADENGALDLFIAGQDTVGSTETSVLYRNAPSTTAPPDPPTSLTATASAGRVDLAWTASDSADVTGYRVYRDTAPIDSAAGPGGRTPLGSTDASTTSFVDSSVTGGTTYYYRATAVDTDDNESGFSGEAQATPPIPLRIAQLQPTNGAPGTPVRIHGAGFSSNASDNTVTLGGTSAPVDSAKTNVIYARVPSGVSGPVSVSVTTPDSSVTAAERFTVTMDGGGFERVATDVVGVQFGDSDVGDVNGDGLPDLVVAGEDTAGAARTTLYLNQGDGTFDAAGVGLVGVEGDQALSTNFGDANGDGHLDILVTGADADGTPTTALYLNDGDGGFERTDAGLADVFDSAAAFGDVNGDGALDLVMSGLNSDFDETATLYLNEGNGTFSVADASSSLTGVRNGSAAFGDVDNDGDLDLLLTGHDGNGATAILYENDGQGGFTATEAGIGSVIRSDVDFGDVNNDGNLDLVVIGDRDSSTVYQNDGTGSFSPFEEDLLEIALGSTEFGDVDGDGWTDLVISGDTSGTVVYRNDEGSGFSPRDEEIRGVQLSTTSWTDVDANGTLDLFVAGDTTGEVGGGGPIAEVYRNGDLSPDPPTDLAATASAGRVDLAWTASDSADVTGYRVYRDTAPIDSAAGPDGRTPLGSTDASTTSFVDSSVTGGTTYYYRATAVDTTDNESGFSGEAQATPSIPLRIAQLQPTNGAPGTPIRIYGAGFSANASDNDVTLDGASAPVDSAKTNVIYARVPSGVSGPVPVSVTTSGRSVTAAGRFNVATRGGQGVSTLGADLAGVDLGGVDWGDYNGDGALDLVVTGVDTNDTEITRIYRNDGNGSVTALDAGITGVNGPAKWGDYNGDGALDLVVVGADTNGAATATIYRNDGNDQFTEIDAGLTGVVSSAAAWGDYNGDGALDLAIIGLDESDARSVRIYRNDGNDQFTEIDETLNGVRNGDVAWGDYNGDGALDLAVIGTDTDNVKTATIYRNDGNGSFSNSGAQLTGVNLGSVAWGDYNGDGALDLALTGSDDEFNRHTTIYENKGDGTFDPLNENLTGVTFGDAEWGDYDGDGALDLAVIGDSTGTVQAGGGMATIYQNDGGGSFSRAGTGMTGVEGGAVDWGDPNQDGALDLVVTGLDADSNKTAALYLNETGASVPPSNLSVSAPSVADSSARLRASVDPGDGSTTVTFEYGLDTDYGRTVTGTESPLSGGSTQTDSADVAGLLPGTTYHYRAVASNGAGADTTDDQTFVTDPSAPVARTDSASSVTETSATLYGTVNPGGDTTDAWVRYWPAGTPSQVDTALTTESPVAGTRDTAVSAAATGLASGTQYAYQAVAANVVDTTRGDTLSLATANAPPVAARDTAQTEEDQPVTVAVLANDAADGTIDTASVTITAPPAFGSASVEASTGAITYVPDPDSNGTDSLRYTVADEAGQTSNEATVVFPVTPVNDPPVAVADTGTVLEDGATDVPVLANDTDVEERLDTASVAVVDSPATGTATVQSGTGTIRYVPTPGYSGPDSLRYEVTDRVGDPAETAKTDTGTVRLRVVEVTLAALQDTSRTRPVQVGQPGRPLQLTFENQGEASLTNLQVSLAGPDAGDYTVADGAGEDPLAPGDSRTVSVTFAPTAPGVRSAVLRVLSAEGGADSTALVGRAARLTAEPGDVSRGSDAPVDVVVEGAFSPQAGSLQVRKGGASAYQAFTLSEAGTDPLRLRATVPATLVTTRGLDYYAVLAAGPDTLTLPAGGAEAARQNPAHLPVRFNELAVPVSVQPETYRMMTLSARPDEGIKAALEDTYGEYDPVEWRVLRWDPTEESDGDYVEFPSIESLEPGAAFWLITAGGDSLSLNEGETVGASEPVRIPVQGGWNQVGSPFDFPVRWEAVRAATGLDSSATDGPVTYADSAYRYGRPTLKPWTGAFVRVPGPDTLVVPAVAAGDQQDDGGPEEAALGPVALRKSGTLGAPATGAPSTGTSLRGGPPAETPGTERPASERSVDGRVARRRSRADAARSRARPTPGETVSPTETGPETASPETASKESGTADASSSDASSVENRYTLRMGARPTGGEAHRVWLGLRQEAKRGRDALDFAQAPPIGRTVRLSVQETVSGREVPHAGSFKPPSSDGQAWTLVLTNRSEKAQDARLRLRSEGRLPEGHQRYVLDLGAERRVAPGTTLDLDGGEERRLKVLVGTKAFAESESEGIELNTFKNELRANYPNPFGGETTLAYTLKDERAVRIEIYDVLGRQVRTLVRGRKQGAGLHEVRWHGETRYGKPAGSGVYFYRIEAGDFTATQKMVLVR